MYELGEVNLYNYFYVELFLLFIYLFIYFYFLTEHKAMQASGNAHRVRLYN